MNTGLSWLFEETAKVGSSISRGKTVWQRNTTRIQSRGFLGSDPMQDARGPCCIDRNCENCRLQLFIVDRTDTPQSCDSGDRKACRDKVYGRRRQKWSGLFDSHRYLKLFVDVSLMIHRYANWGKEVKKRQERHSFFSSWFPTTPYPQPYSGRIPNGFKHYMEVTWIKKGLWDWSRHRVARWNRCTRRIYVRCWQPTYIFFILTINFANHLPSRPTAACSTFSNLNPKGRACDLLQIVNSSSLTANYLATLFMYIMLFLIHLCFYIVFTPHPNMHRYGKFIWIWNSCNNVVTWKC